jgi:hypothetical protein
MGASNNKPEEHDGLSALPAEILTLEIARHLDLVSRCALAMASKGLRQVLAQTGAAP